MSCKGICIRYKSEKPSGRNGRYDTGQKRCNTCVIFINWDGKYCPCCGVLLRTKPRGAKMRRQLMVLQQAKRI